VGRALSVSPDAAAAYGASFTWERATDQFLAALDEAVRSHAIDDALVEA